MFYFRRHNGLSNFGDDLSPVILEHALGRPVEFADPESCTIAGLGSLMSAVESGIRRRILAGNFNPIWVWGTGTISAGRPIAALRLNVLATRGRRTQARIWPRPCHAALGDPALLLSQMYRRASTKSYSCCFVPHFVDADHKVVAGLATRIKHSTVANVSGDWKEVVEAIRQSELVVSSSLHGIIAADALGIPSVWVRISDRVIGGAWKFDDYFSTFTCTPPSRIDLVDDLSFKVLRDLATLRPANEVATISDTLTRVLREAFP